MRNKLIKLVSRSTRCRLFWDHFKTCWDVCGAFEDINLDKLNHKHNNEALSLFQFWDIPTMFGTFWDVSGQVLGHETFVFLGHFGTFRDISKTKIFGIRSGNHSGGPSIEANWPTEPGTFVWRMAISKHFGTYFGTCWDISGHPLSMCTNDRSSIQPCRAFRTKIPFKRHVKFREQNAYISSQLILFELYEKCMQQRKSISFTYNCHKHINKT